MTFYVARHGQTEWNAENKICGITNIDLTEKGIVQADELAEIPVYCGDTFVKNVY